MNSDIETTKRKRKRSESYSSSDRSRSRSRNDRKKSKKSKKKHSKSKKREDKRKRSRSKKTSKRSSRHKSKSRTPSSRSESPVKQFPGMPMDPMQMMYYNPMMGPRDTRMFRPPVFYPPYPGDTSRAPIRPPPISSSMAPRSLDMGLTADQAPDKIVKDQNFLNSDEKLFDSIIHNEMHLRSVFEDAQISESSLGSTLYKSVKKFVHDPNTIIFESSGIAVDKSKTEETVLPKNIEIIKNSIDNILYNASYNRISFDLGDMTSIKEQLYGYRNRHETEELNNI